MLSLSNGLTICYTFGGANNPQSTFDIAYQYCSNGAIATYGWFQQPFDYGRVATFETPAYYATIMQFVRGLSSTNNATLIGAAAGLGATTLNNYNWRQTSLSDSAGAIGSTSNTPVHAVSTTATWIAIGANPQAPFQFNAYDTSALNMPVLCEFGTEKTFYLNFLFL